MAWFIMPELVKTRASEDWVMSWSIMPGLVETSGIPRLGNITVIMSELECVIPEKIEVLTNPSIITLISPISDNMTCTNSCRSRIGGCRLYYVRTFLKLYYPRVRGVLKKS